MIRRLFRKIILIKHQISYSPYEFEDQGEFGWDCKCTCDGIYGYGAAKSKTKAKKKASYMVLVRLCDSAGICEPEWKDRMH